MRGRPHTEADFWALIDRSGGNAACWPWSGRIKSGAGTICFAGKNVTAHRLAYELTHGVTIEKTKLIARSCGSLTCCNPAHVVIGPRGIQCQQNTKLTREIVLEIRAAVANGASQRALAATYGVTQPTISQIVKRQTWREVE